MDKKRWLALMIVPAVVALGVAFGAAEARSRSVDDCAAPRAVLARVGTVPVTQDDFRWASVQGRAAGSRLDPRSALRDLLWQEAERQRQRLPGGEHARLSRRQALNDYVARRAQGAPALPLAEMPPGAELTSCGRQVH